jgi:hypothetical protein
MRELFAHLTDQLNMTRVVILLVKQHSRPLSERTSANGSQDVR